VTSFKVTTNNKTLIGELNASESAQEKYSDAIAEGKGAYLLDQKRADIITLYIGNNIILYKNKLFLITLKYKNQF
jgi:poly [ADP-ribose] polymerase